jgi:hypothetical protein
MAEAETPPLGRAELRRRLRARLGDLGRPVRLLGEAILGAGDREIDWVGAESDGRAWLGLLAPGPGNARLLEEGLVQRAWLEARLSDWLQLAPGLGLRTDARPRLVLVASRFRHATRIAARESDGEGIRLAVFHFRGGSAVALEGLAAPAGPRAQALADVADPLPLRSRFRTGLTDADLAVGPAGVPVFLPVGAP